MSEAARDTRLSLQARAIAFWILENPSEAINPDAISAANNMTIGYVRKLLAELAKFGYLVAPQKVRNKDGRFSYTPYTLPPQAKITVTVDEPARSDDQHGQEAVTDKTTVCAETPQAKITSTVRIAHGSDSHAEYTRAAGENALAKSSLVLLEKQKDKAKLSSTDNSEQDARATTDPSGPVIGPAASKIVPESPFGSKISSTKSPVPSSDPQPAPASVEASTSSPSPQVPGDPPPEDDAVDYWHTHLGPLSGGYRVRLTKAVKKYGLELVQEAIDAAKAEGARVQFKMSWIESRLEGEAVKAANGSRHKPAPEPIEQDPPLRKFTGWGTPAPKGVAT